MKILAFFNNKAGVGRTSLVYHLAWLFASRGVRTLAVDLDPQANLTSMFLDEERLVELWEDDSAHTVSGAIEPLLQRTGDIPAEPWVELVGADGRLGLVPGDLGLSRFEDLLSENWPKCLSGDAGAFRVITAFYRMIRNAAVRHNAELVLVDVGPNLGAINRAALISVDQVVIPLAPDLFSQQGLKNLGPTLRRWRRDWEKRLEEAPPQLGLELPAGKMNPLGYVVLQHGVREGRPVKAYQRWVDRIPKIYREAVLNETGGSIPPVEADPCRLMLLKHYRSLMPLAMEARKPMFFLKPADGAIGSHIEAVRSCEQDFLALARKIDDGTGLMRLRPHAVAD